MELSEELNSLKEAFPQRFDGAQPTHLIRAPGRINLIGEHTDYNGFPVLPMAIDPAIRVAVAPRDDAAVELRDVAQITYGDRRFPVSDAIASYDQGDWGNYAKAAVQSLAQLAAEEGRAPGELRGMSCLVDGDIPSAAGLSSSTALVVAMGLAFSAVNGLGVGRRRMAERMAVAEHYVGTQGGGMDQAVCLLAREGEALKIDFFPLRATRYPFPADYVIVAAHSTVRAKKTGQHRLLYNRRVLECRIGAHLLARRLEVDPPERLADLACRVSNPATDLPALLDEAMEGRESLSLRRAAALFDTDAGRFMRSFLRLEDGRLLPMPGDGLKVLQRCRHVFGEAERTERAAECLKAGDMAGFGRLMDASHRSCAQDYEISCYELDQLAGLMREAGALGARLTGAGFGGFTIGLVHRDRVAAVQHAVIEGFYVPRGQETDGNVFVFEPQEGALDQRVD